MNKQIKLISLLFILAASLLVSCDDEPAVGTKLYPEEQVDFKTVKAYISTGNYPINFVSWTLYQTPVEIKKLEKDTISFYVLLSKKCEKDVEVNLSDNISLTEKYNKDNGTEFKSLPQGTIKILTPNIVIKAGATKSKEKVKAVLDYDKVKDIKESGLGSIVINKVSEGIKIASSMSVIHVLLHKEFTNINMEGSLNRAEFVDRAKYAVTTMTDWGGKFSISNITDNNLSTSWAYETSENPSLQFSLDETTEIKGIRTIPFVYNGYYGYNSKRIKVYTSLDGKEWENQGVFVASFPSSQAPIDIAFYETVKTKYIKIEITRCAF